MTGPRRSVASAIRDALLTGEAKAKVFAARQVARDWRLGQLDFVFEVTMPDRPEWPDRLELLAPGAMPRRGKMGSERNRAALWHALAHIEFVAIDLALDMAGRFGEAMGPDFVSDFLEVAADEAMHFALLSRKLDSLGGPTGRCLRTTGCGARLRTPLTMLRRGWRSFPWCSRRAAWTSHRPH